MWVGTAVIGSVIGAGASIYSANKAADAQKEAAQKAADTQTAMYNQTRSDLSPYRQIGQTATDQMTNRLAELTSPITMDQATLEKTPGYQFNLTQGLKAATNSAAARGLGKSGAAVKGATTFATGLADSTYQNQFNNAQLNQKNAYDRLKSLIDTGENASAQTGTAGMNAANQTSSAQTQAGTAQAAAYNLAGQSISKSANDLSGYAMYRGIYGGNNNNAMSQANPYSTMLQAGRDF